MQQIRASATSERPVAIPIILRGRPRFESKTYGTRIDQFRVREGLELLLWAQAANVVRVQLGRYRAALDEPHSNVLAKLVRGASELLVRPVKASELYDLGEDEPLGPGGRRPARANDGVRIVYPTRFDRLLRRIDLPPNVLSRESGFSRKTLWRFRMEAAFPLVSSVRRLVVTLRRLGYDIRASDLVDVGEEVPADEGCPR